VIFSTFDTRDLDKSQPNMNCGTHIIRRALQGHALRWGAARPSQLASCVMAITVNLVGL
jgi:hypothetical protein